VFLDASGGIYVTDTRNNRISLVTKSTGIISTVASDGRSDYVAVGGQAKSAKLIPPSGITSDADENTDIVEVGLIRMVTRSTGVISTVTGHGIKGDGGDGGPATSAQLWNPTGIAVDALGTIHIADSSNHRIRMVTKSTDSLFTVPCHGRYGPRGSSRDGDGDGDGDGRRATSIRLSYPTSVALDKSGNIYIADSFYHRNRMMTKNTAIVTTVAGIARTSFYRVDRGQATSADMRSPTGITLDRSESVYIADAGEDRIRMVSTGIITTVVGKGMLGYSGDGGPATSATLSSPAAVAMDRLGNMYIADTDNNRIHVYSSV
jgi:trimeric autotransporter adhesin